MDRGAWRGGWRIASLSQQLKASSRIATLEPAALLTFDDLFQLLQMIDVAPRHGLKDRLERHRAALGMRDFLRMGLFRDGVDQRYVPAADRRKQLQRRLRVIGGIGFCPAILIEGLNHVVRLGQRLAQAKSEHQLAIGQMTEYLSGG